MKKHNPWHRHPAVNNDLTLGERSADRLRNVMGSWPFVFGFILIMILWAIVNTVFLVKVLHHNSFDPYPYILLNLFLSMLAGLQGAILLIAAKRADSIAAQQAIHHLSISEKTDANTEAIQTLLADNTNLTREVHELVKAVHGAVIHTPELETTPEPEPEIEVVKPKRPCRPRKPRSPGSPTQ